MLRLTCFAAITPPDLNEFCFFVPRFGDGGGFGGIGVLMVTGAGGGSAAGAPAAGAGGGSSASQKYDAIAASEAAKNGPARASPACDFQAFHQRSQAQNAPAHSANKNKTLCELGAGRRVAGRCVGAALDAMDYFGTISLGDGWFATKSPEPKAAEPAKLGAAAPPMPLDQLARTLIARLPAATLAHVAVLADVQRATAARVAAVLAENGKASMVMPVYITEAPSGGGGGGGDYDAAAATPGAPSALRTPPRAGGFSAIAIDMDDEMASAEKKTRGGGAATPPSSKAAEIEARLRTLNPEVPAPAPPPAPAPAPGPFAEAIGGK